MKKFAATLFSFLSLNLVILFAHSAMAEDLSRARETSIGRLVIPVFKARTTNKGLDKFWANHKKDIQKSFIKFFNAKASFETVASPQEFGFDSPLKTVVLDARQYKGDGVLIGEFLGQSFDFQIRSALTGHLMARMSAPIPDSNTTVTEVVSSAVNSLIASFGYDAFILAVHKNEVKINAGKNQGVKVNDQFDVFDFDGNPPSFSSPLHKIGDLKISQVADFASLGVVSSNETPAVPYNKVVRSDRQAKVAAQPQAPQPRAAVRNAEPKPAPTPPEKNTYKVSRHFWVAPGLGYFSINTQVPSTAAVAVQLRSLQAPLSPGFDLGLGISRLTINGLISSLSNTSNSVSVIQGLGLFQFYTVNFSSNSLFTSAGIYYSSYNVTPSANPTTLLITSTTLAPTLEECYQFVVSPRTVVMGALALYYPVSSSDASNGASGSGSLGYGFDVNWRTTFSEHLGLNLGARAHYFNIQTSGVAINETEFILSSHFFYLF